MPLQGVTDVMEHFKNYTDIPHIAQLSTEVNIQLFCFKLIFIIYLHSLIGKTTSEVFSNTNYGRFS